MREIIAYLNDDARLDETIEQAEGTVLVELGSPVLATPAAAVAVTRGVVATVAVFG